MNVNTKHPSWNADYWFEGSSIWRAHLTRIEYANGDVVWVSKRTGLGYAGRTYNGLVWSCFIDKPCREQVRFSS